MDHGCLLRACVQFPLSTVGVSPRLDPFLSPSVRPLEGVVLPRIPSLRPAHAAASFFRTLFNVLKEEGEPLSLPLPFKNCFNCYLSVYFVDNYRSGILKCILKKSFLRIQHKAQCDRPALTSFMSLLHVWERRDPRSGTESSDPALGDGAGLG